MEDPNRLRFADVDEGGGVIRVIGASDPGETQDVFDAQRERRPSWTRQLEALSGELDIEEGDAPDVDAETLERLRALGYFD